MFSDAQLLQWYFDTFNDGGLRLWCASCGDEVIHAPPHSEPEYVDDQGQYVCPFCAELYYWQINGIKPMVEGTTYYKGGRSWNGPFYT